MNDPRPEPRRFGLWLVLGLGVFLSASRSAEGSNPCPTDPGPPRPLAAGEVWSCDLPLAPGDTLHGRVEQRDIDLAVALQGPSEETLLEVDDPTGRRGLEIFHFEAASRGTYRLQIVAPPDGGPGTFRLELEHRRRPRSRDRLRARTYRTFRNLEHSRHTHDAAQRAATEMAYSLQVDRWLELDEPLLAARVLRRLGDFAADRGEFRAAIRHYQRADPLYRQYDQGWERIAQHLSFADALRHTDAPDRARELLQEALDDSHRVGSERGIAISLDRFGILALFLGRNEQARGFFRRALEVWEGQSEEDAASTLHHLGLLAESLGDVPEARGYLQKAEVLRRRGSQKHLDITLGALGWLELHAGHLDRARKLALEALALRPEASPDRVSWLELLGCVEMAEGNTREARRLFESALDQVEGRGNRLDEALLSLRLAQLLVSLPSPRPQDLTEGRLFLEVAFAYLEEVGSREGLQAAHAIYADLERLSGRPEDAITHLETALELAELGRGALTPGATRATFFARHRGLLDSLVRSFLALGGPTSTRRAFAASERARGRTLLDEVSGIDWRQRLDPAQRRQEQTSREHLNARAYRREEHLQRGETAAAALLGEKLQGLEVEHQQLLRDLRRSIGLGAAAEPLGAAEIQALLDAETTLLSFHWTPSQLTLFRVAPERIEAFALTADAEATEALRHRLQSFLASAPDSDPSFPREAAAEARQLARILLGPVAPRLEGQRLVVVGDGPLLALPFAALPHPRVAGRFLVEDHELVHLPSASLLGALRQQPPCAPELDLALFADPVYGPDDERLEAVEISARPQESQPTRGDSPRQVLSATAEGSGLLGAWARLPATAEEADSVLERMPPEASIVSIRGFEVQRDAALGILPRARWIHFATHGFASTDAGSESGLVLSLFDSQGEAIDGLLRGRDIASQQLCAEQVVLSACRSGLGRELRGEGLLGLSHAFFLAGARTVVAAHWNVHDEATAALLARYYRALLEDELPPPAALRRAQLQLLRETRWRAPAFWAGFTVQGDWR